MTRRVPAFIYVALLVSSFTIAKAQSGQEVAPSIGFDPYGTFQSSKIDHVNVLNGNVVLKIPLLTLPQRGAFRPITYSIINNSMPWTVNSSFDSSGNGYYYGHAISFLPNANYSPDGVEIKPDTPPEWGGNVAIISYTAVGNTNPSQAIQWSVTDYSGATHPAVYNYNDPSELRTLDGSMFRLKFQDFTYGGTTYSEPYFYAHNYDVGYGIDTGHYPAQDLYNVMPDLYDSNGVRTVRAPEGTAWAGGVQRVVGYVDQDGNSMPIVQFAGWMTDTMGRTISGSGPVGISSSDNPSGHCPNLGFPDQQAIGYSIESLVETYGTTTPDPRYTYTVCYTTINYRTNFWGGFGTSSPAGDDGIIGYVEPNSISPPNSSYGPANMIQSITLPDGSYWGFVYDNVRTSYASQATVPHSGYIATGMLTKVITPEGGAISYCYDTSYPFTPDTVGHAAASLPLLTRRWEQVSAGSNQDACSAPTGTYWSYQLRPWSGGGGLGASPMLDRVIDPMGNETDYTYGVGGEVAETNYQGCFSETIDPECDGGGAVLRATTTTYDNRGLPEPYGDSDYTQQFSSYPIATTTSLNGTMVGNTASSYQGNFTGTSWECYIYGAHPPNPPTACNIPPGSSGVPYLVGQPSYTFSYQGSGTSNVLSLEQKTFLGVSGSCGGDPDGDCYWDNNLLNLPAYVARSDSNGNSVFTQYFYDESGYTSGGRGHLTTTVVGYTPFSHRHWNSQGMLSEVDDPNGNATYKAYDGTGLYTDHITYADGTVSYYSFDPTSSAANWVKDVNGNQTNYHYDAEGRPWAIQYPDAGGGLSEVACYPSATQVSVYQAQGSSALSSSLGSGGLANASACASSSSALKKTENVDGLGRVISTIVRAPEGDTETDTTYDVMNRVHSVSNPYLVGGSPNAWTINMGYDALSRPTQVNGGSSSLSSPGGDVKRWSYDVWAPTGSPAQARTTAVDEDLNNTQSTTDMLGRITNAFEPIVSNSTSGMLGTQYSYSISGLANVCQGPTGGSCGLSRAFIYDGAGRLTSANNPETGTITYIYTSGSSLCSGVLSQSCRKTDARGATTTYTYDNMNRMTSKTLSGVSGVPLSCYQYGGTTTTVPNGIGRLVVEWTQTGSSCATSPTAAGSALVSQRSIVSYDVMGRIKQEKQCVKSICSISSPPVVNYSYDLGGKTTSYTNGIAPGVDGAMSFANQFDSAGRLSTLTSSWNDWAHPALLFSAQTYNPFGLTNANLGNHLNLQKTYDLRLRVSTEDVVTH